MKINLRQVQFESQMKHKRRTDMIIHHGGTESTERSSSTTKDSEGSNERSVVEVFPERIIAEPFSVSSASLWCTLAHGDLNTCKKRLITAT